jgi:abortive infection bacteriophage resistance protein
VPYNDFFVFTDFFTTEQHIQLLKDRGLLFRTIYEEESFKRLVNAVGYYRVSQYFKHFYKKETPKTFLSGTKAKQIIAAYKQNERLRALLIEALIKIEGKLNTLLTEHMITLSKDIYWCYQPHFQHFKLVEAATESRVNQKTGKPAYAHQATRLFLEHYPEHSQLPAWVVMQCQSFGTLCVLLKQEGVPNDVTKIMTKKWTLPQKYSYKSFYPALNALRYLRNLCVHNEKLLGEFLRIAPPLWQGINEKEANYLPNFLCWVTHLLQGVTERKSFSKELNEIIKATQENCPLSLQLHMP